MALARSIQQQLSSYAPSELIDIYNWLSKRLSADRHFSKRLNGSARVEEDNFVVRLEHAIAETLSDRGSPIAIARIRTLPDYRKFVQKSETVEAFVTNVRGTNTQRMAFLRVGVECLIDYLTDMKLPIDGITVVRNIDKIPRAVDKAFPGYAGYGLLHMIVRSKVNGTRSSRERNNASVL